MRPDRPNLQMPSEDYGRKRVGEREGERMNERKEERKKERKKKRERKKERKKGNLWSLWINLLTVHLPSSVCGTLPMPNSQNTYVRMCACGEGEKKLACFYFLIHTHARRHAYLAVIARLVRRHRFQLLVVNFHLQPHAVTVVLRKGMFELI